MSIKKLCILATLIAGTTVIELASAQDFQRPPRGNNFAVTGDQDRQGRAPQHRSRRGATPESIIERADVDLDGRLDEAEFVDSKLTNIEERFLRRDADGDGSLSREETEGRRRGVDLDIDISTLRECIAQEGGNFDLEVDRFAEADLNDDGFISFDEFVISTEERAYAQFARIDLDSDGYISYEELEASIQAKKDHREIVKACMQEATDPLL